MTKNNDFEFNITDKLPYNSNIDDEMVDVMSKLLNIPKKEILKSKSLFSQIKPGIKSCFYSLYRMKENNYTSAGMLLEYLLISKKPVSDIID